MRSLSDLLKGQENVCIKIDVEGFERSVLKGTEKYLSSLSNEKVKIAVCVYHTWNDALEIPNMLKNLLPHQEVSSNYVCLCADYENGVIVNGSMPFLRHAVLRAWR